MFWISPRLSIYVLLPVHRPWLSRYGVFGRQIHALYGKNSGFARRAFPPKGAGKNLAGHAGCGAPTSKKKPKFAALTSPTANTIDRNLRADLFLEPVSCRCSRCSWALTFVLVLWQGGRQVIERGRITLGEPHRVFTLFMTRP